MKKRFMCLLLSVLMLVSACLLAGCGEKTTEEELEDINKVASKSTTTLTMFMITEKHVPTKEEVAELLEKNGENSAEYQEAKNTMEAYDLVAAALDKITKAKFKTHLVTTFYTEEEYEAVEDIMEYQTRTAEMKEEAKKALRKYTREQKAMGILDTAVIQSMFYAEHPEYLEYTDTATAAPDVSTAPETVTGSYGNTELKYPDVKPNQIDILCVCGYDKYLEYSENNWLAALDGELEEESKVLLTYVNDKFITAASSIGNIYGIPNNTTIGEYTYLLIHKELYNYYMYDIDSLPKGSGALYSQDFTRFLDDIKKFEEDYAPITGTIELTNELFMSLDYKFINIGNIASVDQVGKNSLFFSKVTDANGEESYRILTAIPDSGQSYAVATETLFTGTEFSGGTDYYTKGEDGFYTKATEYMSGETYYTLTFKDIVPTEKEPFEKFEDGKVYFQKTSSDSTPYIPVYTLNPETEYYKVMDATLNTDKFNVLGAITNYDYNAEDGKFLSFDIFGNNQYTNQVKALKKLLSKVQNEDGTEGDYVYYDPTALTDTNKKFATAVVKGGAALNDVYGDEYYLHVLEFPKASIEDLCSNLLAVSSSCSQNNIPRAMEVITYINTNPEFRNLLQYGIEGEHYTLENVVDPETGVAYKYAKRINSYYMMDIKKTGNMFIAYPDETMSYQVWEYGKEQNADATYAPLREFSVINYVSQIDFSVIHHLNKLSAKYEELINNCKTEEELDEVFAQIRSELSNDIYYQRDISHGASIYSDGSFASKLSYNNYGLYHNYMTWWTTSPYFKPVSME